MEIKPTYVDFNTAKLLKSKGFEIKCNKYYDENGLLEDYFGYFHYNFCDAPEWNIVLEWLRLKHDIWIVVEQNLTNQNTKTDEIKYYSYTIQDKKNDILNLEHQYFWNNPQKAYSAAFDYVLNNLI